MARRSKPAPRRPASAADLPTDGLIQHSGIFPNSELEVALLMQEETADKNLRVDICRRITVQAVAVVKACLQEARALKANAADADAKAEVAGDLRRTFGQMINGSRFRAMWDLGDATPIQIAATVAKMAIGELVELKANVTDAQLQAQAAELLLEVEQVHGVTHVVVDARQGSLL